MAQVSVPPPSPAMSKRAPLSNLPNAVNSPYQMAPSIKRSRSVQRDVSHGQPPPKKQAVETTPQLRTPVRRLQQAADAAAPPPKRAAPRTRPPTVGGPSFVEIGQQTRRQVASKPYHEPVNDQQADEVRTWQKHYRKAFPGFVFFFENIPQDVQIKAQKQILSLGATCEKYFCAKVTHLITNRTLPSNSPHQPSAVARRSSRATINPAPIDQKTDYHRAGRGSTDVLLRAKEYGMRIWAIEKLDRVLNVLLDFVSNRPALTVAYPRTHPRDQSARTYHATAHQNDLSHLLRNERLHGPTDRDPTVAAKDLHFWKGPYIYVHDMFATYRPIILREYPKVQRREDGAWPQFRSVSGGRCPFIEEHVHQQREKDRTGRGGEDVGQARRGEDARANAAAAAAEARPLRKETRTVAPEQQRHKQLARDSAAPKERSPARGRTYVGRSKKILAEVNAMTDHRINSRASAPGTASGPSKRAAPPPPPPPPPPAPAPAPAAVAAAAAASYPGLENAIAFTATNETASSRAVQRYNVEPAASGVQPSNITSAIRSQMISSYQDQPGQRAGTSKEIHALQRKVAGNVLLGGNRASRPATMARKSTDLLSKAPASRATPSRGGKRGHEVLLRLEEEVGHHQQQHGEVRATQKTQAEPKPGYCENCREKFDDFEEHTSSRQHRKFATNNKNWEGLDDLLGQLRRPVKRSG